MPGDSSVYTQFHVVGADVMLCSYSIILSFRGNRWPARRDTYLHSLRGQMLDVRVYIKEKQISKSLVDWEKLPTALDTVVDVSPSPRSAPRNSIA